MYMTNYSIFELELAAQLFKGKLFHEKVKKHISALSIFFLVTCFIIKVHTVIRTYDLHQVLGLACRSQNVRTLFRLSLPPLSFLLITGGLSQIEEAPQAPVVRGEGLGIGDLLQAYQAKVRGGGSGGRGVPQVDSVEPAPWPKLAKVCLKGKQ